MASKLETVMKADYIEKLFFVTYANAATLEGAPFADDTLIGGNGIDAVYGDAKSLPFNAFGDFGGLTLQFGSDHLFGNNADDLVVGDFGMLDLRPLGDASNINGLLGHDYVDGGNGSDILIGDKMLDITTVNYNFTNIYELCGDDELRGGGNDDILMGDCYLHEEQVNPLGATPITFDHIHECGADLLYGDNGNDILVGDEGTFTFNTQGAVVLTFSEIFGDDKLVGGSGDDILIGDTYNFAFTHDNSVSIQEFELIFGDDIINGGKGNDSLTGDYAKLSASDATNVEEGQNLFAFDLRSSDGSDKIMDFDSDEDELGFVVSSGSTIASVDSQIKSFKSDGDGGTLVSFKNGASIDFVGVAYAGQHSIADMVDQDTQILISTSPTAWG